MKAVRAGDVPGKSAFQQQERYWWKTIYRHASSFKMGDRDFGIIIALVKEVEKAGVIAVGSDQDIYETLQLKKEFKSDTCMQQAVVGCIPLVGGIGAHLIGGGATVMTEVAGEGFGVSGLVESLFGIGKDLFSFVTEPVVDKFLKGGKLVLAEDAWEKIPDANKRAVIDATGEQGITIEDLKTRIDVMLDPAVVRGNAGIKDVANAPSSTILQSHIESILEELPQHNQKTGQESSAGAFLVPETQDGDGTQITEVVEEGSHDDSVEVTTADDKSEELDKEKLREELAQLRKTPINSSAVLEISSLELASLLATFMVKYDLRLVDEFEEMRCRLEKLFRSEWIQGDVFTDNGDDAEKDREDMLEVLLEARNERIAKRMKKIFNAFVKRSQDVDEQKATKSLIKKNFSRTGVRRQNQQFRGAHAQTLFPIDESAGPNLRIRLSGRIAVPTPRFAP